MRIGIIGPSKLKEQEKIAEIAEIIAKSGHKIVVTPDRGLSSEFFAQKYLDNKGKKVYSVVPLDDKEFGFVWLNLKLGEKINCGTWRNQSEKLNELSDILLCVGRTDGVLAEIAYAKWFKPKGIETKRVYIVKELCLGELPKYACKGSDVKYISMSDLEKELK